MTKKISLYGILIAQAIIMGYIERMIPIPIPIPGIKLGLANIVVVISLYVFGEKQSIGIGIIKAIVIGFMFSGPSGILYSLTGTGISLFFMILFRRIGCFSIIGVSIIGSVTHNLGQIIMASLIVNNFKIFYYYPILIWVGIFTGGLTGYLCLVCLKSITIYGQRNAI
jgi:heptaprenyl diphosphate synthase